MLTFQPRGDWNSLLWKARRPVPCRALMYPDYIPVFHWVWCVNVCVCVSLLYPCIVLLRRREMIYRPPLNSDWSFALKQGNKEIKGWQNCFLNFLTLSVFLSCLLVSVSVSLAVRLPRLQLVIHFSSATRSVPCVLIRANSLVGLTQVSLKHWSDLLPGCTLTSVCSGNYYCSPHFMHKHSTPYLSLTPMHVGLHTLTRTYCLQNVNTYSFVSENFLNTSQFTRVESVKYKNT